MGFYQNTDLDLFDLTKDFEHIKTYLWKNKNFTN